MLKQSIKDIYITVIELRQIVKVQEAVVCSQPNLHRSNLRHLTQVSRALLENLLLKTNWIPSQIRVEIY